MDDGNQQEQDAMRFVFRFDDPKPLIISAIAGMLMYYSLSDRWQMADNGHSDWHTYQSYLALNSLFIAGFVVYLLVSYIKWIPDDRVDREKEPKD